MEDLKDAEADQMIRAMKFGAVLVKKNQTTETEFYSNGTEREEKRSRRGREEER